MVRRYFITGDYDHSVQPNGDGPNVNDGNNKEQ